MHSATETIVDPVKAKAFLDGCLRLRLNRAAPDMLDALTAFMDHFAPLEHVKEPHPEVLRIFAMARKAREAASEKEAK